MAKQKVQFMETVLRDGQQSLIATNPMPSSEYVRFLDKWMRPRTTALEMWGGATFDACLRYLNEDPWERLRKILSSRQAHIVADVAAWPKLAWL